MLGKPSRLRIALSVGAVIANLPVLALAGLVLYLQMRGVLSRDPDWGWVEPLEDYFGTDFETRRWLWPLYISAGLYAVAWLATLDWRRSRRPQARLFGLNAEVGALLGALVAFRLDVPFAPGAGFATAGAVAFPWIPWALEALAARGLAALTCRIACSPAPAPIGMWLARVAILLAPRHEGLLRIMGLARFRARRLDEALTLLEPLRENAGREPYDMDVVHALEACYREQKNWSATLPLARALLTADPENWRLRLRVAETCEALDLWRESVAVLRKGLPNTRSEYVERLLAAALKAGDVEAALEVARALEKKESAPRPRTESALRRTVEAQPRSVRAREALADFLVRHKRDEEAHDSLEKAVLVDPDRWDLRRRLVAWYDRRQQHEFARKHLEALVDAGQADFDHLAMYCEHLVRRRELERVEPTLEAACEKYPDASRFAVLRARSAIERDNLEAAEHWCEVAERCDPDEEDLSRLSGLRARIDQRRTDADLQEWRKRCEQDPGNVSLTLGLLKAMVRHGLIDEAVREYDGLLERNPQVLDPVIADLDASVNEETGGFRLLDYVAMLKVRARRWDEALETARMLSESRLVDGQGLLIEHCRRILNFRPDHLPALRALETALLRKGRNSEAVDAWERRRRLGDTESSSDYCALFDGYLEREQPDKAVEIGEERVRVAGRDIPLRLRIARAYAAREDYDRALEHLRAAQDADYYHADAAALMREIAAKRRGQRFGILRETLAASPDNPDANLEMGDLYLERGESKRAITHFQKVMNHPELRNLAGAKLAQAMARLGMYDIAEETLDEVSLRVENPEEQRKIKAIFYSVAEILQQNDEPARALKVFKKVFRVDASYRNVVEKVETLNAQLQY